MATQDLIGSWTLVSTRMHDEAGHEITPYTDATTGLLIYTGDGYMSASVDFVDAVGNHRRVFYAGPCELLGDRNIHHVEFSNQPELIGTPQERSVEFDGTQLTLRARESIVGGPGTQAEITWRRAG